jgi:hypothetical protein
VGLWEHGGDHVVVERESFDFLDGRSWDLQLVLRDLLRSREMKRTGLGASGGFAIENSDGALIYV